MVVPFAKCKVVALLHGVIVKAKWLVSYAKKGKLSPRLYGLPYGQGASPDGMVK